MKAITIFGIILFLATGTYGQSNSLKKAHNYFAKGEYELAFLKYDKSVKKKNQPYFEEIYFNMAECKRILYDTIIWSYYSNCIYYQFYQDSTQRINRYRRMAFSNYYIGEYERSMLWFKRLKSIEQMDSNEIRLYKQTIIKSDSINALKSCNQFFKTKIGIEITEDIKEINCVELYSSDYQMAFYCNQNTLAKIVDKLDLEQKTLTLPDNRYIINIGNEYLWWQNNELESIKVVYRTKRYPNTKGGGPWIEIYYNKGISKLFLIRYDL